MGWRLVSFNGGMTVTVGPVRHHPLAPRSPPLKRKRKGPLALNCDASKKAAFNVLLATAPFARTACSMASALALAGTATLADQSPGVPAGCSVTGNHAPGD